jgi:hypothetical protein
VRGEVANILVLVLRPKGQLRVPDHAHRPGSDGVTALAGGTGKAGGKAGQVRGKREAGQVRSGRKRDRSEVRY